MMQVLFAMHRGRSRLSRICTIRGIGSHVPNAANLVQACFKSGPSSLQPGWRCPNFLEEFICRSPAHALVKSEPAITPLRADSGEPYDLGLCVAAQCKILIPCKSGYYWNLWQWQNSYKKHNCLCTSDTKSPVCKNRVYTRTRKFHLQPAGFAGNPWVPDPLQDSTTGIPGKLPRNVNSNVRFIKPQPWKPSYSNRIFAKAIPHHFESVTLFQALDVNPFLASHLNIFSKASLPDTQSSDANWPDMVAVNLAAKLCHLGSDARNQLFSQESGL
ncbi:hypothetical protein XELAEV_18042733mg [Xenopus laevis]|uniref:Uncharacterized protein n=1 Tax=Xenopus laevis TaxID=8355 RepID=A0A974H6C8_XENLA|nr:hypothetical protein XELAEV_18042733mg [Xenopus laevis]